MSILTILKNRLAKGIVDLDLKSEKEQASLLGQELKLAVARKFKGSFFIRQVDTGSCGACESEISSLINPIYDLQRYGVNIVASPKHADALLVTGPVSRNMQLALQKAFAATPETKLVISLGDCAADGGIFKGSYYILGGVDKVLPVALHIPGCPPTPLEIIKYLLAFIKGRNPI